MSRFFTVLIFAFVLSILFTAICIWIFPSLKLPGLIDRPSARKMHTKPTPRMAGIAIYAAFVIPMLQIWWFSNEQKGIVYGGLLALIIGALDDMFRVPAIVKLITIFGLTVLISHFGVITKFPAPHPALYYWMNLGITMLWITAITSAINMLDHIDGLAGGISCLAALMYLLVSLQIGIYTTENTFFWGLMSASLIGSLLGFLVFNWHPAKIFMGDSGAFFLGFTLAAVGVQGEWSESPLKAGIVPVAILSVAIFDMVYVFVTRWLNGTTRTIRKAIVHCGKDHIGHRLCDLGFSVPGSVGFILLLAGCVAFTALALRHTEPIESVLIFLQIIMFYIVIAIFMKKAATNRKAAPVDTAE
jgi:UDP-GlcNAc:undecaprenyl-phosphate GlcNAc-1-phosphate transferase